MNQVLEELKQKGCNVDTTLERFLGDEDFFLECYEILLHDPNFKELGEELQEHHVEQAFEKAHALKGVIANMGVTPILTSIIPIVEKLRQKDMSNIMSQYAKLLEEKKSLPQ
ncbi:Hpt domain-containing protein [Anaerosporobacter faecicola]|uniref:Hpt domain-containing protein n=1 Tax=Anaerosporobacter faecicola TaxID=2718714 RepID=UPI00143B94C1|nr:Hpt domain-containing protein [Anaerosporobacter faecicola]